MPMLKPRSLECHSRNIKGRHEKLIVNREDLTEEIEKDKHDRKKPLEAWTRLEEFGDADLRRPNPCYTPTLDATIVSCHLFDAFPDSHKWNLSFQNFCLYCVYPYLSLLSHPKTHGPIRGWMEISSYYLDRWLNWTWTDGFRTWKITWRITL